MINSIIDTARNGMMEALKQVSNSAKNIPKAFAIDGSADPSSDIVDMKIASQSYTANAKVLKVGEELSKTALNLLA